MNQRSNFARIGIVFFAIAAIISMTACRSPYLSGEVPASSLTPSTIVFADGSAVFRTVSGGVYTNAVSGAGDGSITYVSGTPATATVNAATGAVTPLAAGTTVITATRAATSTYSAVSNSYTLTVTAVATYNIAYNLNSGTNAIGNPASFTSAVLPLTLAAATRTGYTFGGWYSDSGLTTAYPTILSGTAANVTVYAKWTVASAGLSLTGTVTTIAGLASYSGSTNGIGSAARFHMPYSLCTDNSYLYVAEVGNSDIRKIALSNYNVTTLVNTGYFQGAPTGIAISGTSLYLPDQSGNRFYAGGTTDTVVNKLIGSASGYVNGSATSALFASPTGVAVTGGYVYLTDRSNQAIRKIATTGFAVTTLAGATTWLAPAGYVDGIGTAARFNDPWAIATDGTNLYVTDSYNYRIRKIVIATGEVSTLAGSGTAGSADGIGTAASFSYAKGIATDGTYVYVADTENYRIRKIVIATGEVTTLVGSTHGSVDGNAATARFGWIGGITVGTDCLYVSDVSYNTIRKIQ